MLKLMSNLENSFLLAFGLHLNILCVIAQLLLIRQDLMDSPSYVLLTASLTSSPFTPCVYPANKRSYNQLDQ